MAPPLSTALMQSRPLLDPAPHTIVALLILSNPLFHKCRISDHLHLVFQWGIHTDLISKREVALFTNVYTPPAQARMLRKHEGHPARAPDGTIMEIQGDACPGNTGESVGPWDLGNVHMCEGYAEWSAGLTQTLNMALAAGLKAEEINMPQPSREELEKAQETTSQWLHGRPLHPMTRKSLTAHRDGIRDKLDAFLAFVDLQIKSETRKEKIFTTLREALGTALAGKEVGEYNGVLGGMVNKIIDRIEDFIEYMEERIEGSEAKQQRIEEVREIIETALKGKQKRKRDDEDEGNDQARKKVMTADAKIKTEEDLTTELAEPPKPKKRDRKSRVPSLRKREVKQTKDEDSSLEKLKDTNQQNGEERTSTEQETAVADNDAAKDKIDQSNTDETEKSSSDTSTVTTPPTDTAAKAKEKEAEACSSRRTSTVSSGSANASGRRPGTPPPPYSQHASLSPNNSRAEIQAARRNSQSEHVQQATPRSPMTRNITPSSTPSEEPAVAKQLTPAALILEKIRNAGKRRNESSHTPINSMVSVTYTPSPDNAESVNAIPTSPIDSPDHIMGSISPDPAKEQDAEHDGGDKDDEDSLFLPLKEAASPYRSFNKSPDHYLSPNASSTPAPEEEERASPNDADSLFNHPNTPSRASSYDLELPPLPSKTRQPTPFPSQIQRERQSSYELELPPPPNTRLGTSKMPIDIDLDSDSESSTPGHAREHISIFGGPGSSPSVKIKSESSTSNYIVIKDEEDDDDDLDIVELDGFKGFKQEGFGGMGAGIKEEFAVEIVDEDDGDDGGVMVCSKDEWVKEVKKKNESAAQIQARLGRGAW